MFEGIDFYSDTVTRPSRPMREAMANAEVGDEQLDEDPTTQRLEARVAELLGFSCALFFPTATMANEVALQAHCDRGEELIAALDCHLYFAEAGGPAMLGGIVTRELPTATGIFSGDQVRAAYRNYFGPHFPITKLVSVENTANMGGGIAWRREELESVVTAAKELNLKLHMDGARFFNAVTRTGLSPREIAHGFDSITICFSKGLGCAAGAVLAFDVALKPKIQRLKQLMGGSLRQSGILSAGCLYALDHNIERMAEDHANAAALAIALSGVSPYIKVESTEPDTNMVYFRWHHAKVTDAQFAESCEKRGVRFSLMDTNRFRAVTHLDVSQSDIPKAAQVVKSLCAEI